MEIIYTLDELEIVAKQLLEAIKHPVVLFDAPMGVGKTTLIKQLVKQLGVEDVTSSPTFSIVNEYQSKTNGQSIFHFDLYRIEVEEEAYDMGLDEYLDSGHWCFIEWPDKIPNLIPESHSHIGIELLENDKRKLVLKN